MKYFRIAAKGNEINDLLNENEAVELAVIDACDEISIEEAYTFKALGFRFINTNAVYLDNDKNYRFCLRSCNSDKIVLSSFEYANAAIAYAENSNLIVFDCKRELNKVHFERIGGFYRKVGEVFERDGVKLTVVKEKNKCEGCFFNDGECAGMKCTSIDRPDGENVIFKMYERKNIILTFFNAKHLHRKK